MPLIPAGLRHDHHLPARPLAQLRAVGIPLHIKFAHGLHAKQHSARPAWRHIVFRRAGVLYRVQQEDILLRAITGHGEIIRRGRIGNPGSARFLRSEIDNPRIERKQQIVTSPVQGQILHSLLPHKAADVPRRHAHDRRVARDFHFRLHRTDL